MEIAAQLRYMRMSPRKVRLVADLLRGMDVSKARDQLRFSAKRSAPTLLKLLNSASANAKNNFSKNDSQLFVKKITVDQGPVYKRFRPTGRGHISPINKKTSHITIVLDEHVAEEEKESQEQVPAKEIRKQESSGAKR